MRKLIYAVLFCPLLSSAQPVDTTKAGVFHIKKPASATTKKKSEEKDFIAVPNLSTNLGFPIYSRPAKFPGGDTALNNFLNENIKLPESARQNGIEGIVYVSFTVIESGLVEEAKVIKGLGYGCDEEALRVIKAMPRWNPASEGAKAMPQMVNIPVTFKSK